MKPSVIPGKMGKKPFKFEVLPARIRAHLRNKLEFQVHKHNAELAKANKWLEKATNPDNLLVLQGKPFMQLAMKQSSKVVDLFKNI